MKINKSAIVNVDGVDLVCYYPTYEEFLKLNDAHYKFLQENFGNQIADEMMRAQYEGISNEDQNRETRGTFNIHWNTTSHGNDNITFIPYIFNTTNQSEIYVKGPINAVFLNLYDWQLYSYLEDEGWNSAVGWNEYNPLVIG